MEWFGISGNANPNFLNDWAEVTTTTNDKFGDNGNWIDGNCELPVLHVIDVIYQKINTVEDPQYMLLSIQHSSTSK